MFNLILVFCCAFVSFSTALNERILEPRIVNGSLAHIQSHNYMVSVQHNGKHICGGVILSRTRILTAGSCTEEKSPNSLSVRAGSTRREVGGKVFHIIAVFPHPNYNSKTFEFDLSILILDSSIVFNTAARSIGLIPPERVVPINSSCSTLGWGAPGRYKYPSIQLHLATLTRTVGARCLERYGEDSYFEDSMLCFEPESGAPCEGDAGGPLVCGDVLFGLVTYDYVCRAKLRAFTNVAHQSAYRFINKFI